MLEVDLIFPNLSKRALLTEFLRLPGILAPTRTSVGENERGSAISNRPEDLEELDRRTSGFFLKNKRCSYDINIVDVGPIKCSCFVEVEASQAKILLTRLAAAQPLFGFACLPEERETKNRVVNKLGVTTIESWVGRDIEKALPGLYWCTLIPEPLAQKHRVPLAALSSAALEHVALGQAQHLFRFYEKPEDWQNAKEIVALSSSLPGIFNVEIAREALARAKTWQEHVDLAEPWR